MLRSISLLMVEKANQIKTKILSKSEKIYNKTNSKIENGKIENTKTHNKTNNIAKSKNNAKSKFVIMVKKKDIEEQLQLKHTEELKNLEELEKEHESEVKAQLLRQKEELEKKQKELEEKEAEFLCKEAELRKKEEELKNSVPRRILGKDTTKKIRIGTTKNTYNAVNTTRKINNENLEVNHNTNVRQDDNNSVQNHEKYTIMLEDSNINVSKVNPTQINQNLNVSSQDSFLYQNTSLSDNKLIQKKQILKPRKLQKRSLLPASNIQLDIQDRDDEYNSNNQGLHDVNNNNNINIVTDQYTGKLIEIDSKTLVKDCINIITECDPNKSCSKDQLIARVAYQLKVLLKQTNGIRTQKIAAMEKILGDLNEEWTQKHLSTMDTVRKKQDKLMTPMEKDAFKQRTDLSKDRKVGDPLDPALQVQIDSKKYWKNIESKNRDLFRPAKEIEKKFTQTKGNVKMPNDIRKKIY